MVNGTAKTVVSGTELYYWKKRAVGLAVRKLLAHNFMVKFLGLEDDDVDRD